MTITLIIAYLILILLCILGGKHITDTSNSEQNLNKLHHQILNKFLQGNSEQISVDFLLGQHFQETCTIDSLTSLFDSIFPVNTVSNSCNKVIEIFPGKNLNINVDLDESQQKQLIYVLQKYSKAFAWEYTDMQGIHLDTCTHHIYIQENVKPV
jgi:hypothetical protein